MDFVTVVAKFCFFSIGAGHALMRLCDRPPDVAMEASLNQLKSKLSNVAQECVVMRGGGGGRLASGVMDHMNLGRHPAGHARLRTGSLVVVTSTVRGWPPMRRYQ